MARNKTQTVRVVQKKTEQEKKMRRIATSQAKKVVNRNIESKIYDGNLPLAGDNVDYDGRLFYATEDPQTATNIVQGIGQGQYIGEEIRPTHLSVRWSASNDLADATNMVTFVIIQAKGAFTSLGSMANILQSTGNVSAPLSPFDVDFDDRFRVLHRKTIALSQVGPDNRVFKVNIGYNMFQKIVFNDASGTIEANPIIMGFVTDSGAAVHPIIKAKWRLHYKDA